MSVTTSAHQIIRKHPMDDHDRLPPELWEIMERYRGELANQALAIVGNISDAEDVVQETFCDAFRNREQLAQVESLGAWLRSINHSKAVDRLRRVQRQRGRAERKKRELPERTMTTGGFSMLELRDSVAKAIETLPDELRSVVVLRFWEQLTLEEIAARLRIAPITVRRRLYEACLSLYRNSGLKIFVKETLTETEPRP